MLRTKENVQQLLDNNYSLKKMGTIFGITAAPMRKWLTKNGLCAQKRRANKWTDTEFITAVKNNTNPTGILKALNLTLGTGNYTNIKRHCKRLGLDTAHFCRLHTVRAARYNLKNEDMFISQCNIARTAVKRRIIKDGLIAYKCSICGLDNHWNNKLLVLVLDHINGIYNDNRLDNLRFLCPNCNSQEPTFCGKNKVKPIAIEKVPVIPRIQIINEERLKLLNESDIDTMKWGSVNKLSKLWCVSHTQVRRILKKNSISCHGRIYIANIPE